MWLNFFSINEYLSHYDIFIFSYLLCDKCFDPTNIILLEGVAYEHEYLAWDWNRILNESYQYYH